MYSLCSSHRRVMSAVHSAKFWVDSESCHTYRSRLQSETPCVGLVCMYMGHIQIPDSESVDTWVLFVVLSSADVCL